MAINGNRKGKCGEREWRDQLRAEGFMARRGQQFAGSPDSPDVICEELSQFHFEVKRVEKLNVLNAMMQATDDSGSKTPVVCHRSNRGPWMVTMLSTDWFDLVRESISIPEYRMLGVGDVVQMGDEYYNHKGTWGPSVSIGWRVGIPDAGFIRRKNA